ncbi:hypothetical protein ACQP0C_10935 [Nocardia sp. CA-129566]
MALLVVGFREERRMWPEIERMEELADRMRKQREQNERMREQRDGQ